MIFSVAIPEVVSEGTSSPELELEDATRTVHVGGKWISQSVEQTEHTIIDVGMPASGDFMKYYEWCTSFLLYFFARIVMPLS